MDKNTAINTVKNYKDLLIKNHIHFDKIYLYGSYAKGTSTEESDIDVAIIMDESKDEYFVMVPLLWKLRRTIDFRIEPLLIETKYDKSGFLNEIIKTGIEIN